MSAPMIIPFNFQPVTTGRGTTTYTVPLGKYAIVTLNCSASLVAKTLSNSAIASNISTGGAVSVSEMLYLKAGDIITVSVTNYNGTYAIAASTSLFLDYTNNATIFVNASVVCTVAANLAFTCSNGTGGALQYGVIGNASAVYNYSEYNEIS